MPVRRGLPSGLCIREYPVGDGSAGENVPFEILTIAEDYAMIKTTY